MNKDLEFKIYLLIRKIKNIPKYINLYFGYINNLLNRQKEGQIIIVETLNGRLILLKYLEDLNEGTGEVFVKGRYYISKKEIYGKYFKYENRLELPPIMGNTIFKRIKLKEKY